MEIRKTTQLIISPWFKLLWPWMYLGIDWAYTMTQLRQLASFYVMVQILFITLAEPNPVVSKSFSLSLHALSNSNKGCVQSPSWLPGFVDYYDCLDALNVFHRAEGGKPGSQRFEFIASGAQQKSGLLPLTTPRLYSAGTCTIVAALLTDVPAKDRPIKWIPPESSDVATLDELQTAAKSIVDDCVLHRRRWPAAGWQVVGHWSGNLAVFLWETGCDMDVEIRQHDVHMYNLSRNRTSAA